MADKKPDTLRQVRYNEGEVGSVQIIQQLNSLMVIIEHNYADEDIYCAMAWFKERYKEYLKQTTTGV